MENTIAFKGHFDEATRLAMRARIEKMNIAHRHIADFLGVSKCTLQKWLNGSTTDCSRAHLPRLNAFLNGDLNIEMENAARHDSASKYMPHLQKNTSSIESLLERIAHAYEVCGKHDRNEDFSISLSLACETIANEIILSIPKTQGR